MEPTSEVSSFHSMKLGGVWGSGGIADLYGRVVWLQVRAKSQKIKNFIP